MNKDIKKKLGKQSIINGKWFLNKDLLKAVLPLLREIWFELPIKIKNKEKLKNVTVEKLFTKKDFLDYLEELVKENEKPAHEE